MKLFPVLIFIHIFPLCDALSSLLGWSFSASRVHKGILDKRL